jgi:hypothetical protein
LVESTNNKVVKLALQTLLPEGKGCLSKQLIKQVGGLLQNSQRFDEIFDMVAKALIIQPRLPLKIILAVDDYVELRLKNIQWKGPRNSDGSNDYRLNVYGREVDIRDIWSCLSVEKFAATLDHWIKRR